MNNCITKKIIGTVFLLLFILCLPFSEFSVNKDELRKVPFKRGVNLSKWLEVKDVRQIPFKKYTEEDFINIKKLGCDVIRLPIDLKYMTNGAPNYIIDPIFFNILDQIVDWAEKLKIHLILDNHTLDAAVPTDPHIDVVLILLWTQMAKHYKDRSAYIYYEIQNEPHGISDAKWNEIQQKVINIIREIDQKHTIIIGPPDFNNYKNLGQMPKYNDSNLIYTFHFYDPWIFTSQGVSWSVPPAVSLSGVPFPYDKNKMPKCPADLKNTWIEDKINNYNNEGNEQAVKELIDIAVDFGKQRHVPLYCGEFGVYMPNCAENERVYWYKLVRKYLEEKNIA
jgi:endoglucanase